MAAWFKAWETEGLKGLQDKARSGRPPTIDDQDRERLQALILEHPHQLRTVRARLHEETGKSPSTATLKRALKKIGHSFKRIRRSLTGRRDETDFRNTQGLMSALQAWEDQGITELYYFDESGFSQSSALPYAWSPIGQPLEITAFSRSRRLNVLGFLSRRGKLVYQSTTESVTTETVIAAFDHFIAQKAPDAFAVVVLDNASMHRSMAFQRKRLEWLHQRGHVVHLSAYSPELNLIEILWRRVKYAWLPLTAYERFGTLCSEVERILSGYGTEYAVSFA